jgi:predicted DNA-binding WGR domain protein
VREWGRIGQPGTVREAWFETEGAAIEAGERVRQRKEKRGYRAVGG